jgi:uncharacterized protein YecE (DUF72 family)
MTCDVRIGTSGFHYHHWKGPFYPADISDHGMLDYYIQHFDTVELNNSFYRLPTPEAFDTWSNRTGPNFVLAVKGSRFITHNKKLKDPENALDNLIPRVARLGKKLGPLLFQLPPRWRVNAERLEYFLQVLPRELRYTFEFRDTSWITPDIARLLQKSNAAFCIYELAGYRSPSWVTADFAYVRLHGPTVGKYQGSYSKECLRDWARQIESWAKQLKAIYVYFDNDQNGYAASNALTLKRMVLGR